jgi:hypothetical protein
MKGQKVMRKLFVIAVLGTALPMMSTAASMTGTCANGEPFKLVKTTVMVSGEERPHFIFEGPLGRGEVQSSVDMAAARELVCRDSQQHRWLDDEQRDD